MSVLKAIAEIDWRVLAVLGAVVVSVVWGLLWLLSKARRIDLPFMHVVLGTPEQRKARRASRGKR
jgi:hypothetical protein